MIDQLDHAGLARTHLSEPERLAPVVGEIDLEQLRIPGLGGRDSKERVDPVAPSVSPKASVWSTSASAMRIPAPPRARRGASSPDRAGCRDPRSLRGRARSDLGS